MAWGRSAPAAWPAMREAAARLPEAFPVQDNPTRAFIAEAIAAGRRDVALDINPAFASLGSVLEEGRPGCVTLRFTAGPQSAQGNGVVGGGTLANMLDCALAVAALSTLAPGHTCSTVSLTVNMLRAANVGALWVRASVDRTGRRMVFAQAQLFDAQQRLVATATSALAVASPGG